MSGESVLQHELYFSITSAQLEKICFNKEQSESLLIIVIFYNLLPCIMQNLKRYVASSSGSTPSSASSSSGSATSDSDSDSSSDHQGPAFETRSLTLNQLTSLEVEIGSKCDVARRNGKDPDRIRTVLKDGACQCQRRCHKHVGFKVLLAVCISFWSLTKAAQDCLFPDISFETCCCYFLTLIVFWFQSLPVQTNSENQGFGACRTNPSIPGTRMRMMIATPAVKIPQTNLKVIGSSKANRLFLNVFWTVVFESLVGLMFDR